MIYISKENLKNFATYCKSWSQYDLEDSEIIDQFLEENSIDTRLFYEQNGTKFYVGDEVTGKFRFKERKGIIMFGKFDAYWPTGAHECADAYGFYVKTSKHDGYSICEVENLRKI